MSNNTIPVGSLVKITQSKWYAEIYGADLKDPVFITFSAPVFSAIAYKEIDERRQQLKILMMGERASKRIYLYGKNMYYCEALTGAGIVRCHIHLNDLEILA